MFSHFWCTAQEVASTQPDIALGHIFVDEPYNRVNLTLASENGAAVSVRLVQSGTGRGQPNHCTDAQQNL